MTIRAVILGLLLGLGVSTATYFNDFIIRQTYLIGNHLPITVFGVAVILLLVLNPLLRAIGANLPLRGGEIALITAIGLAACGWPSSNFYRSFATIATMPSHWLRSEASWRAAQVMSYVPGGSADVAAGHVPNWPGLIRTLERAEEAAADADSPDALAEVGALLSEQTRFRLRELERNGRFTPSDVNQALSALNSDLIEPTTIEVEPSRVLHARLSERGLLPDAAARPLARVAALQERIETLRARRGELRGPPSGAGGDVEDDAEALPLDDLPLPADTDAELVAGADTSADGDEAADAAATARRAAVSAIERELVSLVGEARHTEQRVNRTALVSLLEGLVRPMPAGGGVLVAGGRADPVAVDALLEGRDDVGVMDVPWALWWPVIWLWGGLALLTGVAALCLALVVHPQWSRRELLAYPIARFVEEIGERKAGAWLPAMASNQVFWYGFVALLVFHLINGLYAWMGDPWPQIPRSFDFEAVTELFPNASRVWGSYAYFYPTLFPSVVAFTFFLTTSVSFSLGISQAMYMALGSALLLYGMPIENDYIGGEQANLMRFGAYFGIALMIAYTGRRYYTNVIGSAAGLSRKADTPGYAVWAARGLVLALVLGVVWLQQAGLDWVLACVFLALVMLTFLVMARIVAETGAFFLQAYWLPVGIITALFGIEAIGPTGYILLAVASVMIVGDPREALMPFLTNGLQMTERAGKQSPRGVAPWLAVMIIAGFLVAGVVTLTLQYHHGVAGTDGWMRQTLPSMPFGEMTNQISELGARGVLAEATDRSGLDRLLAIRPEAGALTWTLVGLALVIGAASARLRLPWWPLHPVAFLVWGTYPLAQFTASFLIGWMIKASVVQLGGARGYHSLKPFMVGVIAGELVAGLIWMGVGVVYFYLTDGQTPTRYAIFPG
ncbi:MAG: DUF6785 family protein [Phycisphaeraceae bacterium]